MGKLQKLIDNKAQSAKFMCDEIAHICNDMPKRDPGSEGEKMACEYMADYLKTTADAKDRTWKPSPNTPTRFSAGFISRSRLCLQAWFFSSFADTRRNSDGTRFCDFVRSIRSLQKTR